MRIAYVHYLCADDTACHHARQFALAAEALGHRVEIHAMNPVQGDAGVSNGGASHGRARRLLGRWLHEPRELARNVRYVGAESRMLAASRPDVLLVRDHFLTASCVPVARRLGIPLVLEMNAPAAEARLYQPEYWHVPRVAEGLEGWKLRHAARVTVVSGALRDHLVRLHDVPPAKFAVVPNGADPAVFRDDLEPDDELRGAGGEGAVVGFVGSFKEWHGSDLLAQMMVAVVRARPSTRFLLVGDGPRAGAVRAATAALNGRVRFLGTVPHARIPRLVAALDVGVVPDCGFYMSPLKVLEWMSAGRAVVAPAHAPLGEIIDDGVHGLLFPPARLDDLVAAVVRLVDDAGLRRRLGAAAAARVRGGLTWRHNAERVVAACTEAIAA